MSETYPELIFNDSEDFNADVLNRAFRNLDLRVRGIEGLSMSYEQAVDTLNQFGLQRLNDAIQPIYDKLVTIAQIGVIFSAPTDTSASLTLGPKTFMIDDDRRTTFAPAAYLQIQNTADTSQALYGTTQSYDAATGTLVVLVDQLRGISSGPISSWMVSAAGTPDLISTAHDIGAYTQGETDSHIASAVAALKGSPPAGLGTLEGLATAITAITAGAPAALDTFAEVSTALDNRLRVDTAQGLNATALGVAQSNLGISAFIKTLLDDADASTALATLGISTFIKTLLDDADASTALSTLGVSPFIKTLLDDANQAAALATLGAAPLTGTPAGNFSALQMNFGNVTNFYAALISAMPSLVFDTNDYWQYDRTNNALRYYIGGVEKLYLDANTLNILGSPVHTDARNGFAGSAGKAMGLINDIVYATDYNSATVPTDEFGVLALLDFTASASNAILWGRANPGWNGGSANTAFTYIDLIDMSGGGAGVRVTTSALNTSPTINAVGSYMPPVHCQISIGTLVKGRTYRLAFRAYKNVNSGPIKLYDCQIGVTTCA